MEVFLLLESIDIKKSFNFDKVHPLPLSSAAPTVIVHRFMSLIYHLSKAFFQTV